MRKILNKLLMIFAICYSATNYVSANPPSKIYISQVIKHNALDITTKGIIDALEKNGFKSNVNLDLQLDIAQGNINLAAQIASKFVNKNPDIVVGVGTVSAQSFLKYTKNNNFKLIFSTVTDPIGAGLIKNFVDENDKITGVSNFIDLQPQIEIFTNIQPNLKKLGIIYNPGENNSIAIINKLELICPKFGIKLVRQVANNTNDISISATKLVSQVDAIFISNDNNALSGLGTIIQIANKSKIPVYVSDTDAVQLGALAAIGPNQYQVGIQTGEMIASILNGKDIRQIKPEFPKSQELYINLDAAKIINIDIPEAIKKQASKIISQDK